MYKATNDLSPPCIVVDLFKLNNSDYHLRKSDFIIPLLNFSSIWQTWPALSQPYNLGKLNSYIRSSKPLSIFKNGLSM